MRSSWASFVAHADDWPGKLPGHVIGIDALIRRENWRRAQDAWARDNGLWRDRFEELQRQQLATRTPSLTSQNNPKPVD